MLRSTTTLFIIQRTFNQFKRKRKVKKKKVRLLSDVKHWKKSNVKRQHRKLILKIKLDVLGPPPQKNILHFQD